jgi:hypothetical protein
MSVLTIDFPETLSAKLSKLAGKDKSEMERFVLIAVAEKLDYLEERAKRANLEDFEKILSKVPRIEPEEIDKIR